MSVRIDSIPLVSICCLTYNHEYYIRKCLEGFVMQQTNFSFEILVHEDASTDETAAMIKEYETKFPNLFRCVYQTENQFLKQNTLTNILFPMARGKYIAMCEGDDYWTDSNKLQKQVDFLEDNPDYAICFSGYEILNEFNNTKTVQIPAPQSIDIKTMIRQNSYSTATAVFKSEYFKPIPSWFGKVIFGDWSIYLTIMHASKKKAFCINDITAVYRIHKGGFHGNLHASNQKLVKANKQHIDFYRSVQENLFKADYADLINECIRVRKQIIADLLRKDDRNLAALLSKFY